MGPSVCSLLYSLLLFGVSPFPLLVSSLLFFEVSSPPPLFPYQNAGRVPRLSNKNTYKQPIYVPERRTRAKTVQRSNAVIPVLAALGGTPGGMLHKRCNRRKEGRRRHITYISTGKATDTQGGMLHKRFKRRKKETHNLY